MRRSPTRPLVALTGALAGVLAGGGAGCGAELAGPQAVDAGGRPVDAAPLVDAPPPPPDARACVGGDARVVEPGGSCLVLFTAPAVFGNAQAACTALGARLVVIGNAQLNTAVTNLVGARDAFIGGTDQAAEGTFQWITGAGLSYTNWRAGEPNNGNGGFEEDCMILEGARGGSWDDRPCAPPPMGAGAYAYVCQS